MTKHLRIDNDSDHAWLLALVNRWLSYDPNNPRLQANVDQILAWKNYLENATSKPTSAAPVITAVDDSKPVEPTPKPRGRPPSKATIAKRKALEKAAKKKVKDINPMACKDHPTYGGVQRPRRDCTRCWEVYKMFHPADWKTVYAAFQRDQKKKQVVKKGSF